MLIYYKKVFLVRKPHNIYLLEGHFKITFSSVLEYNLSQEFNRSTRQVKASMVI